ncbi:MAG: MBOAT family O-acyltransferase [Halieaceae bacterium]
MVFSSATFLFAFLPIVLILAWLSPRAARNALLLLASLLFYAWGEAIYVLLMLVSIGINYAFGSAIARALAAERRPRALLIGGVTINLLLLAYFKYANFIADNLASVLTWFGWSMPGLEPVHLPLGISFFTFQAISYLVDVYRREAVHDRNIVNVALYIALFPQLIAGPIVRYHDIAAQLRQHLVTIDLAYSGITRFICGLAKKMLIANPLGEVADQIFAASGGDLTAPVAWLGLLCYSLQIYFDFSGYSDMAIGLGRMLGFRFLENFNYPYVAQSLQDFWRRWHISLSSWFRDYLYISLGGNRGGVLRTYRNLVLVFLLCGLWHGASWNFVIWGGIHGAFLVLERAGFSRVLARMPSLLAHAYTLLVVMLAWVFFRAETLPESVSYLASLFSLNAGNDQIHYLGFYLDARIIATLAVALVLTAPVTRSLRDGIARFNPSFALASQSFVLAGLFYLSCLTLAAGAYNPFIYFRF